MLSTPSRSAPLRHRQLLPRFPPWRMQPRNIRAISTFQPLSCPGSQNSVQQKPSIEGCPLPPENCWQARSTTHDLHSPLGEELQRRPRMQRSCPNTRHLDFVLVSHSSSIAAAIAALPRTCVTVILAALTSWCRQPSPSRSNEHKTDIYGLCTLGGPTYHLLRIPAKHILHLYTH